MVIKVLGYQRFFSKDENDEHREKEYVKIYFTCPRKVLSTDNVDEPMCEGDQCGSVIFPADLPTLGKLVVGAEYVLYFGHYLSYDGTFKCFPTDLFIRTKE